MDLVDLIVLVCSLASPEACSEKHIILEMRGSLAACTMQAPPMLAQWVGEHPKLRVARWRCAWPQQEARRS